MYWGVMKMYSLDEFKKYLDKKSYSYNTKKMYLLNAKDFLILCDKRSLQVTALKSTQLNNLINHISINKMKHSTNAYITAVKAFYFYLLDYDYIDTMPISKGHYLKEEVKEKRTLSNEEQVIFKTYILNFNDKKKHSLLLMLYGGLKISEICTVNNVKFENNLLKINVLGKRNKKRTIFINDYPKVESLIEFFKEGSTLDLKESSLKNIISNISKKLRIKITSHILRRTYAENLITEGVSINDIQDMMGYDVIESTIKCIN